jgi:hypothetical protein
MFQDCEATAPVGLVIVTAATRQGWTAAIETSMSRSFGERATPPRDHPLVTTEPVIIARVGDHDRSTRANISLGSGHDFVASALTDLNVTRTALMRDVRDHGAEAPVRPDRRILNGGKDERRSWRVIISSDGGEACAVAGYVRPAPRAPPCTRAGQAGWG